MSDLVERLRKWLHGDDLAVIRQAADTIESLTEKAFMITAYDAQLVEALREAQAEIERLRREMKAGTAHSGLVYPSEQEDK